MSSEAGPVIVRPAVDADVPVLASRLGEAFAGNALIRWMFPDERARRRKLAPLYARQLRQEHLPNGVVDVAVRDGTPVGAAVWAPPGGLPVPARRHLAHLPGLLWILRWDAIRWGQRFAAVAALEAARPSTSHWYFAFMAVFAGQQRRGVSGALVRHGLSRVDATGLPVYGELTAPYYAARLRAHGFRVHAPVRIRDAPPIHPVCRPAGSIGGDRGVARGNVGGAW